MKDKISILVIDNKDLERRTILLDKLAPLAIVYYLDVNLERVRHFPSSFQDISNGPKGTNFDLLLIHCSDSSWSNDFKYNLRIWYSGYSSKQSVVEKFEDQINRPLIGSNGSLSSHEAEEIISYYSIRKELGFTVIPEGSDKYRPKCLIWPDYSHQVVNFLNSIYFRKIKLRELRVVPLPESVRQKQPIYDLFIKSLVMNLSLAEDDIVDPLHEKYQNLFLELRKELLNEHEA